MNNFENTVNILKHKTSSLEHSFKIIKHAPEIKSSHVINRTPEADYQKVALETRGKLLEGVRQGSITLQEFSLALKASDDYQVSLGKARYNNFTQKESSQIHKKLTKYSDLITKYKGNGDSTDGNVRVNKKTENLYNSLKKAFSQKSKLGFGSQFSSSFDSRPSDKSPTSLLQKAEEQAYLKGALQRPSDGSIYQDERKSVQDYYGKNLPTKSKQFSKKEVAQAANRYLNNFDNNQKVWGKRLKGAPLNLSNLEQLAKNPNIKGEEANDLACSIALLKQKTSSPQQAKALELSEHIDKLTPKEKSFLGRTKKYNERTLLTAGFDPNKIFGKSGSPDPGSIEQGKLGDCYFLAGVQGMKPEEIKNMFQQNRDGSYTISFPGGEKSTVKPRATTDILANRSSANGVWISMLEDAAKPHIESANKAVGMPGKFEEGGLGNGVELLTGKKITVYDLTYDLRSNIYPSESRHGFNSYGSIKDLRSTISSSLKNGEIVTTATEPSDPMGGIHSSNGFVLSHAYTVKHYDQKTDIVTLENPHNWDRRGSKGYGGEVELTFREFQSTFRSLYVAGRNQTIQESAEALLRAR